MLDRSDHRAAPSRPELAKLCTVVGHEFNQSANSDQIKASKRKQMKTKLLSFTNVYFFKSNLFNRLQPSQTKKFSSVLARVPGCRGWSRALFPCSRDCAKSSLPNIIARTSVFAKKMSGKLTLDHAERCEAERKAHRVVQRGAVANSIAFRRIEAAPAAEIRCLTFQAPVLGTLPSWGTLTK